jgi:8-oxo-dGTP pyrophosphatase MutT (NUDIX family)
MQRDDDAWRDGAVMIAIAAKSPHGVLFVERGSHLRRHPGEIGLPGGASDDVDANDPVKTALRELHEELNISAEHVSVVGVLPVVRQSRSRFSITPIVAVLDATTTYAIDGDEIVGVFAVPLTEIVEDGGLYDDEELTGTVGRPMHAFDFEGRHIWGFTGRILKSFVDKWREPNSTMRAAIDSAFAALRQ